jgi:hypothetical protein
MAIPKDLEEPLMKINEVAQILEVSCNTVRYSLAGTVIPFIPVGKKGKRFDPQVIRNYKSNNTKFYGDKRKLKGVS